MWHLASLKGKTFLFLSGTLWESPTQITIGDVCGGWNYFRKRTSVKREKPPSMLCQCNKDFRKEQCMGVIYLQIHLYIPPLASRAFIYCVTSQQRG